MFGQGKNVGPLTNPAVGGLTFGQSLHVDLGVLQFPHIVGISCPENVDDFDLLLGMLSVVFLFSSFSS